jgi:predicted O-methyltransferase YrrM
MNFSLKRLAAYCVDHSSTTDDVLIQLERETNLKTLAPQMISGPLQGQLLAMISRMVQPESILEIGTFTGYSTICLARGLKENGLITTIESNEELKHISDKYFHLAGIESKVNQLLGDAREIVKTLTGPFDMVLIDAGKKDYSYYYDHVIDFLPPGGLIIVDNVLWSGKVTGKKMDGDTKIMHDFNQKIKEDDRVEKIMLPIRDGITLILKK